MLPLIEKAEWRAINTTNQSEEGYSFSLHKINAANLLNVIVSLAGAIDVARERPLNTGIES